MLQVYTATVQTLNRLLCIFFCFLHIGLKDKICQIWWKSKSICVLGLTVRWIIACKNGLYAFSYTLGQMASVAPCTLSLEELVTISQHLKSYPFYVCVTLRVGFTETSKLDQMNTGSPVNIRGHIALISMFFCGSQAQKTLQAWCHTGQQSCSSQCKQGHIDALYFIGSTGLILQLHVVYSCEKMESPSALW